MIFRTNSPYSHSPPEAKVGNWTVQWASCGSCTARHTKSVSYVTVVGGGLYDILMTTKKAFCFLDVSVVFCGFLQYFGSQFFSHATAVFISCLDHLLSPQNPADPRHPLAKVQPVFTSSNSPISEGAIFEYLWWWSLENSATALPVSLTFKLPPSKASTWIISIT